MAATDLFSFLSIKTQLAQNYGDTSDLTLAKCGLWVNRALLRISENKNWSWLFVPDQFFVTSNGIETYVLGSGIQKVYDMYYLQNVRRKLRLVDNRRFREIFTFPQNPSGTPLYYRKIGVDSVTGNLKVALWPVPNTALTVYYDIYKEMPLLLNDTDDIRVVVGMPAHMVDALVELATAIGHQELDDSDYAMEMQECMARWDNIYAEDQSEIDDRIRAAPFDGETVYLGDPVLPPAFGDWI